MKIYKNIYKQINDDAIFVSRSCSWKPSNTSIPVEEVIVAKTQEEKQVRSTPERLLIAFFNVKTVLYWTADFVPSDQPFNANFYYILM